MYYISIIILCFFSVKPIYSAFNGSLKKLLLNGYTFPYKAVESQETQLNQRTFNCCGLRLYIFSLSLHILVRLWKPQKQKARKAEDILDILGILDILDSHPAVLSYSASPDTFRPNKLGEEVTHGQIRAAMVNVCKKTWGEQTIISSV